MAAYKSEQLFASRRETLAGPEGLGAADDSTGQKKNTATRPYLPPLRSVIEAFTHLLGDSSYILVFQADMACLQGSLVHFSHGQCAVRACAESADVDFTRAIADVLAQLKRQQRNLPRKALLITPNILTSLVDLPVSPLRPRPAKEMEELIHWELETALSQQSRQWMIGNILVERDYIAPAERDEILAQLAQRQQQGGQAAMVRFGDLAIELGYISPEQFRDCLRLQSKLVADDDAATYGWSSQHSSEASRAEQLSDEALKNRADDADSAHSWLVSGISQVVRQRWQGAFALNKLRLLALYPVIGTGYACACIGRPVAEPLAVLEVHSQHLALLAGVPGQLQLLAVQARKAAQIQLDECLTLLDQLPSEVPVLQLMTAATEVDELVALLSDWLDIPVQPLAGPTGGDGDINPGNHGPVLGVVSHYLQQIPVAVLGAIKPREREGYALRRALTPGVLIASTAVSTALVLATGLGWVYMETDRVQVQLQDVRRQLQRDRLLVAEYRRVRSERRGLSEAISQAETRLVDYRALVEQVEQSLPRARLAVPGALKGIVISATQGVQLRSLQKQQQNIQLEALALSDSEGLEFVDRLNQWLKPVGFQVQTSEVFRISAAQGERRRKNFAQEASALPYQVDIVLAPYVARNLALTAEQGLD